MGRQQTDAEYRARLAEIGKVEALEPYIMSRTPILHRCLVHGVELKAHPNNVLKGQGLRCCSVAAARERAAEKSEECRREYKAAVEKHGRVIVVGEYIDSKTPLLHRCVKHGEEFYVLPRRFESGSGLACCLRESAKRSKRYLKSKRNYEDRLAEFGKVKLLGEYTTQQTPTLHRCLVHGEEHLSRPCSLLTGKGLSCCRDAAIQETARKRAARSKATYEKALESLGKVELVGEYIDNKTPVLHRCRVHNELHYSKPGHALAGHGLKCCKWRGGDSVTDLKKRPDVANQPCHLYLARINGKYLKPGIAKNPDRRADDFYLGFDFVSPALTRAEAWAIEQSLHLLSYDAKPDALEPEYEDWDGRTELRLKSIYPAAWYIAKYHELVEELAELGWEELYLKHQRN